MSKVKTYNEFLFESKNERKYSSSEKQSLIEHWDKLFKVLKITDKKDQSKLVQTFDKLEGDDHNQDLVEILSDSLDQAKISFNYNDLERFVYDHIKENLSEGIKDEYAELKKMKIKYLQSEWTRLYKIGNPKELDKEGLVSDILHSRHGEKRVQKAFESENLNEAKKPRKGADLVKIFKNETDWGDLKDQVYTKGNNLVFIDSWYYGRKKALENIIKSWSPGGDYYDYFLDEYEIDVEIVDTFSEMNAIGRHKKLSKDGIVGVELKINQL